MSHFLFTFNVSVTSVSFVLPSYNFPINYTFKGRPAELDDPHIMAEMFEIGDVEEVNVILLIHF